MGTVGEAAYLMNRMGFIGEKVVSTAVKYKLIRLQIAEQFGWRLDDINAMPIQQIGDVLAYLSGKAKAEEEKQPKPKGE